MSLQVRDCERTFEATESHLHCLIWASAFTMNSSSLRVTVHGRKYHITGIEKETSCKDLLCALAKATKLNSSRVPPTILEGTEPNERSLRGVYGLKNSSSRTRLNENILNKLKGDCSLAGDTETLRILNSLGSRVKIFARDSVDVAVRSFGAEECLHDHRRRRKKHLSVKEDKTKSNSWDREPSSRKQTKDVSKQQPTHGQLTVKRLHGSRRSVDDSDIDSYKTDSLARIKDRRGKACDDSDVDLYQNLFHMVLEQTKQLNTLRKQHREVRKSSWVRHLKRSSQIYIIDDERAAPTNNRVAETDDRNEDDDDSGLPSADYDSSSSSLEPTLKDENANKLVGDIQIEPPNPNPADEKPSPFVTSQYFGNSFKESNVILEIDRLDELTKSLNSVSSPKQDTVGTTGRVGSCSHGEPNGLSSEQLRDKRTSVQGSCKGDRAGKRLSVSSLSSTTSTVRNEVLKNIDDVEIVVESLPSGAAPTSDMVADNLFLRNGYKQNGSVRRLSDKKKKIKKSDISDPVLLDPASLKKHPKLMDVHPISESAVSETPSKWSYRRSFRGSSWFKKKVEQPELTPVDKLPPPSIVSITSQVTVPPGCVPQLKDSPSESVPASKKETSEGASNEISSSFKSSRGEKLGANASIKGRSNSTCRTEIKHNESRNCVVPLEGLMRPSVVTLVDDTSLPCMAGIADYSRGENSTCVGSVSGPIKTGTDPLVIDAELSQAVTELMPSLAKDHVDIPEPTALHCELPTTPVSVEKPPLVADTAEDKYDKPTTSEMRRYICDSRLSMSIETTPSSPCPLELCSPLSEPSFSSVQPCSPLSEPTFSSVQPCSPSSEPCFPLTQPCLALSDLDEKDRMLVEYMSITDAVRLLMTQIVETHLAISSLTTELQLLDVAEKEALSLQNEEENVFKELNSVKSLLRSVTELTYYQRREVTQNIEALDALELDIRTRRAAFENDARGLWRDSSAHAPRTLLKRRPVVKPLTNFDHISLV